VSVKYLLDASALYPLLKRLGARFYDLVEEMAILDLTKYEIGNAIWVGVKKGLIREWREVAEAWSRVLTRVRELSVKDFVGVEELAVKLDLTFYDSSYVHVARRAGLTLITEDHEMGEKASSVGVKVLSTAEFTSIVEGG